MYASIHVHPYIRDTYLPKKNKTPNIPNFRPLNIQHHRTLTKTGVWYLILLKKTHKTMSPSSVKAENITPHDETPIEKTVCDTQTNTIEFLLP